MRDHRRTVRRVVVGGVLAAVAALGAGMVAGAATGQSGSSAPTDQDGATVQWRAAEPPWGIGGPPPS